jgi:hypothetical protein
MWPCRITRMRSATLQQLLHLGTDYQYGDRDVLLTPKEELEEE